MVKAVVNSPADRARRKLVAICLSVARGVWRQMPGAIRGSFVGEMYARFLHRLVCRFADRRSYAATFFLRNRPELQLLRQLAEMQPLGAAFNLCVQACSKGAEVYSIAWIIRSARPDLQLKIQAVDISPEVVRFAEAGVYSLTSSKLADLLSLENGHPVDELDLNTALDQNASIFGPLSPEEVHSIFEIDNDRARVRPWIKAGVTWHCADACAKSLALQIELQDVVVANRFLCHMKPEAAYGCLRNVASLVRPGGYLFVSGVDLDVRSSVASECGWVPVTPLLREIHEGDQTVRLDWPLEYWGLEPLDDSRPDWQMRYASVFRVGKNDEASPLQPELRHSVS